MKSINILDYIAFILVIIGGINWGLVGLFNFDLVATLFGTLTLLSKTVYILVGAAAAYCIYFVLKLKWNK